MTIKTQELELITQKELCERLGMADRTMRKVLETHPDFPKIMIGNQYRFDYSVVANWMRRKMLEANDQA